MNLFMLLIAYPCLTKVIYFFNTLKILYRLEEMIFSIALLFRLKNLEQTPTPLKFIKIRASFVSFLYFYEPSSSVFAPVIATAHR